MCLKKECSRRKPIHDALDAAYVCGCLDLSELAAKVGELNQMMLDHFQIARIGLVTNEHMAWLRIELSKNRISSNGPNFAERSRIAVSHEAK